MLRYGFHLLCFWLFAAHSAHSLRASVILDYPDPGNSAGDAVNANEFLQASWTLPRAYANVRIVVPLSSWTSGSMFTVSAYLTRGTGSGAPPPIAATSYSNTTQAVAWAGIMPPLSSWRQMVWRNASPIRPP